MIGLVILLLCANISEGSLASNCFKTDLRTSGTVLSEVTYSSEEHCMNLCIETAGCKAAVTSPNSWATRGCYAVGDYTLFTDRGWATAEKDCFDVDFGPSCVAGQRVNQLDGTCVYCPENQWSSGGNNAVCQKCPSGKVVAAGKGRKESDCTWKALTWIPFSVSHQVVISTDFSNEDVERFYVMLPCYASVRFKLFLRRENANGTNAHVEILNKVEGNIYCNGAGARSWYDGEKTDFTMEYGAMKCESDKKNIIILVEKTAYRVTIKNKGRDLYNQAFTNKDGNCRVATKSVKTKVWPKYSGWLGLAVKNSPQDESSTADGGEAADDNSDTEGNSDHGSDESKTNSNEMSTTTILIIIIGVILVGTVIGVYVHFHSLKRKIGNVRNNMREEPVLSAPPVNVREEPVSSAPPVNVREEPVFSAPTVNVQEEPVLFPNQALFNEKSVRAYGEENVPSYEEVMGYGGGYSDDVGGYGD